MTVREEHVPVTRSARIFTLGEAGDASDLWIVCHGYGQLARRFIEQFEPLAAPGRLIVAPEGLHRFYLDPPPAPAAQRRVGASWMTREDRETDIRDYTAYLDAVVKHSTAPGRQPRIHALGFSQAGATVLRWATYGETRLDQLILWAGEVPPDLDLTLTATRLQNTRTIAAWGSHDKVIPRSLLLRNSEALTKAGIAHDVREYDGGHELDLDLLMQLI